MIKVGKADEKTDGVIPLIPGIFPGHDGPLFRCINAVIKCGQHQTIGEVGQFEVEHGRVDLAVSLTLPDPFFKLDHVIQDGGSQVPLDSHFRFCFSGSHCITSEFLYARD